MPRQRKKQRPRGDFGRIVRGHRERLGVTLSELARKVDIDQGLLSKIERGKRPPPQIVPGVQRIAAAFGFLKDSTEFKELMQAAYSGRFGQEWPGGIVSLSLEGGETVLTHRPVIPSGVGEYAPPATREIIRPDSPLGRQLGLRTAEEAVRDRVQREQEIALSSALAAMLTGAPVGIWLQQMLIALQDMGLRVSGFEEAGESFNLKYRLPDGEEWQMSVSRTGHPLGTESVS